MISASGGMIGFVVRSGRGTTHGTAYSAASTKTTPPTDLQNTLIHPLCEVQGRSKTGDRRKGGALPNTQ